MKLALSIPELSTPMWMLSVCKKIFMLSFRGTITCSLLLIIQRILKLMSFLIPLKVILIASSGRLPSFIKDTLPSLELNEFIIKMGFIAILCHICAIKISDFIDSSISSSVKIITDRNKKESFNINIPSQLKIIYSQLVRSISAISFVVLVCVPGLFLNPEVIISFIVLLFIFFLFLFFSVRLDFPVSYDYFYKNRQTFQNWWLFLTYTTVFVVILFQLSFAQVSDKLILTFIAFLLCRYAATAANEFITTSFKISQNRSMINSLLFFDALDKNQTPSFPYQSELTQAKVYKFAKKLLQNSFDEFNITSIRSNNASIYGISCFDIQVGFKDQELTKKISTFCLKIYQPKYQSLSKHESNLLQSNLSLLPAPEIIHQKQIEYFDCKLLQTHSTPSKTNINFSDICLKILCQMWSLPVSHKSLNAYIRTHECDIKRMRIFSIEVLKFCCRNKESSDALKFFEDKFDEIINHVYRMPFALHNPEISMKTVGLLPDQKKALCYHWGRWSVQPIGYTLSQMSNYFSESQIEEIIKFVKNNRIDCHDLNRNQLLMSSEAHKLLKHVENNRCEQAIETLVKVVLYYKRILSDEKTKSEIDVN